MSKYDKYKESAFTHEEMQPMIIETDMTDVFDDLAKAFKAGHDAGRSEAADEIERLRKENEELFTIINSLRAVFYNGIYVSESRVARLKLARTALGEKE